MGRAISGNKAKSLDWKGDNRLTFYDGLIAIRQKTINDGFRKLFDHKKLDTGWTVGVDPKRGKIYSVHLGPPSLQFIPDEHAARMSFPIKRGQYVYGKIYNNETQNLDTLSDRLDGKILSYVIPLKQMKYDHFSDSKLRVYELYLEFTKVKNVDTANFAMDAGLFKLDAVITAFVEQLKSTMIDPDRRLFLGRMTAPKSAVKRGPFKPTSASFSFTQNNQTQSRPGDDNNELNVLVMMDLNTLPADNKAGVFNTPWGNGKSDCTAVLSGYIILQTLILPVIERAYHLRTIQPNRRKINLSRGSAKTPAKLEINATTRPKQTFQLVAAVDDGIIEITATSKYLGTKRMLLGNVTAEATRTQEIRLQLLRGDRDHLKCKVIKNQTTNNNNVQATGFLKLGEVIIKFLQEIGIKGLLPPISVNSPDLTKRFINAGNLLSSIEIPGDEVFELKGVRGFRDCVILDVDYLKKDKP